MVNKELTSTRPVAPTQPRTVTAAVVDALIALASGLVAGAAAGVKVSDGVVELRPQSPAVWGLALGVAVAVSFANHVLLTLAARASCGKLLTGVRVVRAADGGRPRFLRLVGRWLFGFYWMILFVPLHLATDSDVEQQDAAGLRMVRRRTIRS
ncbi:RDD family protein [Streptomyces sp. NPDC046925]|uniref:RDD family protein n=1 Tax=Streptomyces sp. NPDC046925 TaxID=3155375 RepID=UPI0033CB2555